MPLNNKIIENLDGSLTSVSSQNDRDIKDVIDINNRDKFDTRHDKYKGDSQFSHRVARIPLVLVEQMMREGIWGDQERMRVWLNDPENAPFRTTKGKV